MVSLGYVPEDSRTNHCVEVIILRRQAILFVFVGAILLSVAFDPLIVGAALELLGMTPSASRLAGSRLAVMAALIGTGILFFGLAGWARASRIQSICEAHALVLDHLGRDYGARSQVVPGVGAACVADVDGLRMEIVVEPESHGRAWVRARCYPARSLRVCPRGLGPEGSAEDFVTVSEGYSWEAWGIPGVDGPSLDAAAASLGRVFGVGGASHIQHDGGGIELSMPNAPAEELLARLRVAIDAVSILARTNR